jgi:hypothetical protein
MAIEGSREGQEEGREGEAQSEEPGVSGGAPPNLHSIILSLEIGNNWNLEGVCWERVEPDQTQEVQGVH